MSRYSHNYDDSYNHQNTIKFKIDNNNNNNNNNNTSTTATGNANANTTATAGTTHVINKDDCRACNDFKDWMKQKVTHKSSNSTTSTTTTTNNKKVKI